MTDDFWHGLENLIDLYHGGSRPNAAIFCAEALWWKCHRSMIADALYFIGVPVVHLPNKPGRDPKGTKRTLHADAIGNRIERYDPLIIANWRSRMNTYNWTPSHAEARTA